MRVASILVGGVLYALGLPPVDWAFCGWIALVPLMVVVRDQAPGSAFRYGCLFGYAYGWGTMWMLAEVGARFFGLPMPAAVAVVGTYYLVIAGVPCGLFALASSLTLRSSRFPQAIVVVPALWVACELTRTRLFGQPWALLGYTQHDNLSLIQVAAWTGVYGVSFILALVSVSLAEIVHRVRTGDGLGRTLPVATAAAVVVGVSCLSGSIVLRSSASRGAQPRRFEQVAVVQSNVVPALHWTPSYTGAQISAHLRATDLLPTSPGPALIVWPENAVPQYLEANPGLAVLIGDSARRHKADLLFGLPRYEAGRTYNSVRLITAQGRNGGHYDKRRLVLAAEQKPFGAPSKGARANDPQEFAPGSDSAVLQSFVRLGVSICHEIIYPDLITDSVRHGAELLVNVANDGWIDDVSLAAGEQHLAMAIFRAVETRRYLVRAAITGVSAVIDPRGHVLGSLPANQQGVLTVPVEGLDTLTWYVRLGDAFAWTCMVVALLTIGSQCARRRLRVTAPV